MNDEYNTCYFCEKTATKQNKVDSEHCIQHDGLHIYMNIGTNSSKPIYYCQECLIKYGRLFIARLENRNKK